MKCPQCHADNPDTSRFCGNCAALLAEEGQLPGFLTRTLAWFDKYLGPVKR
jgi:predicted amidophosphoribosyltransferase